MTSLALESAAARSDAVLERTPSRSLVLLKAINHPPIRAAMQRAGYTHRDHAEGWKLVMRACGFDAEAAEPAEMTDDVAAAVKEIDAWDEGGYRRARAALARLHPEQAEYVFHNLQAQTGMEAVVGLISFLDRLDALESGEGRKATHKADLAAIATLEQRGIGAEVRKHLRKLVNVVQSSPDLTLKDESVSTHAEEDRRKALVALRAWFEDWSDTARSVITRRDHLIRLGLAARKANGAVVDQGDEPAPEDPGPKPPAK